MPLRCLIVDDNPTFLASASRLLRSQGVEVVGLASSGTQALSLAQELHPDVALVDVELGSEDGFEVASQLHAAKVSVQVILISTHSLDDVAELVMASPALGFLDKTELSAAAISEMLP